MWHALADQPACTQHQAHTRIFIYLSISHTHIAVSGALMWKWAVNDLTSVSETSLTVFKTSCFSLTSFFLPLLLSFLFLPFIIHLLCSRNNIGILTRSHTAPHELHITTKTSQILSNAFWQDFWAIVSSNCFKSLCHLSSAFSNTNARIMRRACPPLLCLPNTERFFCNPLALSGQQYGVFSFYWLA